GENARPRMTPFWLFTRIAPAANFVFVLAGAGVTGRDRSSLASTSQRTTVPACPAAAAVMPSEAKAACWMVPTSQSNAASSCPVAGFQNRTVLSLPPESRSVPSGEKSTDHTTPAWPCRVARFVLVSTSHRLMPLPSAAAMVLPSGATETLRQVFCAKVVVGTPTGTPRVDRISTPSVARTRAVPSGRYPSPWQPASQEYRPAGRSVGTPPFLPVT